MTVLDAELSNKDKENMILDHRIIKWFGLEGTLKII